MLTTDPSLPAVFAQADLSMLGWLAAAAAPILIHIWSRRRYRETPWAAIEYLQAALRQSRRRLRLEELLLLAVRTLLIVFVVLAVFDSLAGHRGVASTAAGRTHRMLVVDGSYSMAYRPNDKSRFDQAKELARDIVAQSRQGDAFTLLLMAAPPRVVVGTPALEPNEVLAEIDNLQVVHTSADLPATMAAVAQLLHNANRENPRLAQHEIYFLTDLDRPGWAPQRSAAAVTEFHRQTAAVAQVASLSVIDVGQPTAENVALTGLRAREPVVSVGRTLTLETTLKNFGRQPRSQQPVALWIDGRRGDQKHVDLAAGAEATVALSCRFDAPGDHTVEARIEGDRLEVDNHRWLVVNARQAIRVLCVNGRPAGEPYRGATDYLAVALSPPSDHGDQPLVQVDTIAENLLRERSLNQYDCVFFADVAQFTSDEARMFEQYLNHGGSLVFFLGEQVQASSYNRELASAPGGTRILPARLQSIVTDQQPGVDPRGYRHPILKEFHGRGQAGLSATPVYKRWSLNLPKDSAAQVVLAASSGDPLVVEEAVSRGRVILVATSADTTWTAMPILGSYVPFVQEMLAWCIGAQAAQQALRVSQPLFASFPAAHGDVPATVERPDGRSMPLRLLASNDYLDLVYSDTMLSGIYTVRLGPPLDRTRSFAVNLDTAESDLTQLTDEQLRHDVWPGIPVIHQTTWQNPEQPPTVPSARPRPFYLALLYVALALLLTDTFLAWRFGYQTP